MIEPKRMTIDEFDAWVERADEGFVYELHDGIVHAFATGTASHGRLCTRIGGMIAPRLASPCEVFFGSISVRRRPERPSSVIPDIVVTCENPPPTQIYATAPKLVVEVVSPGSVVNDLNRKPRIYDAVGSIEEYLLIDSRSMWVRVIRRGADGAFAEDGEGATRPDAVIELTSIGLTFTLDELYRGILETT